MLPRASIALTAAVLVQGCGESESSPAHELEAAQATPEAPATAALAPSASAVVEEPAPAPCAKEPLRAATKPRFDPGASDEFLPRAAPAEVGLDGPAVDALIEGAERSGSDTLLVVKDGRVVVERQLTPKPGLIETRSITKGIAALAILALVADGKIRSLDVPLSEYFSEFTQGDKRAITLRHVMSHTSGLRHAATNADALNAQADRTAYARALPVITPPGTAFSYSNEATQLLSGVIERAAGEPADAFTFRRLLSPLGIRDYHWKKDRAGNVQTYYGLSLTARDMARVGMLISRRGQFGKLRLLPEALVRELFTPGGVYGGYGLCFWLDPQVTQRERLVAALPAPGFEPSALASLTDRTFASSEAYFVEAKKLLPLGPYVRLRTLHRERRGPLETAAGPASALIALGGLGQRLEVHPDADLVAVRQHRRRPGDDAREKQVTFREMQELVFRLKTSCSRERP